MSIDQDNPRPFPLWLEALIGVVFMIIALAGLYLAYQGYGSY